jgi:hypothetical protein
MPYYRKTALVYAEQYLPNEGKIPEGAFNEPDERYKDIYYIRTLEGTHYLRNGDYVCTGAEGEQWNVAQSIFEATYEEVKDPNVKV